MPNMSPSSNHLWIGGLVVVVFMLGYLWSSCKTSTMVGNHPGYVSGSDPVLDAMPTLVVIGRCRKCGSKNPNKMCKNCGACPNCRMEDKCGHCQQFERQVSLSERGVKCIICHKRPCECPSATGKKVEHEPTLVRDSVFSDFAITDFNEGLFSLASKTSSKLPPSKSTAMVMRALQGKA